MKTADMFNDFQWLLCHVCGSKTRDRIKANTEMKNFPLYCPKCKKETIIAAVLCPKRWYSAPCKGEIPRVQIEDLCEGCISLSNAGGLENSYSTLRTSFSLSRFLPWLTLINRSKVSLRIIAFLPTLRTGSLPQSTNLRIVFLPIPVHSAASSMVKPILMLLILSTSFQNTHFATVYL